MAEIVWTEPALSDTNDIAEYIALGNSVAVRQLLPTIFSKVERLETFPDSGRIPPELSQPNYCEIVISPCRIFYKHNAGQVIILFVMREERDLRRFLPGLG